jgi:8-oxo-dGTP pyrophosphatase MutT (NUDIX family)
MVHSRKYDYYKFPGGGIEDGEDHMTALIREVREETGLSVNPSGIREYGMVRRTQKGKNAGTVFVQDNYYYLCAAEGEAVQQDLQGYEAEEGYKLVYVAPRVAIEKNRNLGKTPYSPTMFEREARVLEMLIEEGYFDV